MPHWKVILQEAAVPIDDKLPFNVAELVVILVAGLVVTVGGTGCCPPKAYNLWSVEPKYSVPPLLIAGEPYTIGPSVV